MIDRVGQFSPIQMESKVGKSDQARGGDRLDSISLSQEARNSAEVYQAVELAKAAEVLDEARIAALRESINDPSYINEKIIGATAGKIMEAFGL